MVTTRRLGLAFFALVLAAAMSTPTARAGMLYLKSCSGFNDAATDADVDGLVWEGVGTGAYGLTNRCAQGGSLQILADKAAANGENGQWRTITPPSIGIVAAYTPLNEVLVNPYLSTNGWKASFFWNGGNQAISSAGQCCGGMDYGVGINRADLNGSRYFGFQATCYAAPCEPPPVSELLDVRGIDLEGVDSTPPTLAAPGSSNLWAQVGRYVRGTWPAVFQASADAGICGMYEVIDGQTIFGPTDAHPDTGSWTQCPSPLTMDQSVDTSLYPDGQLSLKLGAWDAANPANSAIPAETLNVDNQPVRLSLAGPSDAPSTAGVQQVSALAMAGPSGVAGIACSLDGSPYLWRHGGQAQLSVEGVGQHHFSCYAQNNATDVHGVPARSALASWTLAIRVPTLISASFAHTADALRCVRRTKRVHVPAHSEMVHRHGRLVHVHRPAVTKRLRITQCHPRIITRRVRVHGRWKVIREPVFPHLVSQSIERVRFGHRATVSGWLGLDDGTAMPAQTVRILSAPDDGSDRFSQVATTTTSRNGGWSASLPPGPSRLIEAQYGGNATTEPASSGDMRIEVPARVRLAVRPAQIGWGGRIIISGRVLGGYIPASKLAVSQLLRLRIGVQGVSETAGIPNVSRSGRFRTTYCFNPGRGVARFWFSVSTLNETDYPFRPAASPRAYVVVGPGSARHRC